MAGYYLSHIRAFVWLRDTMTEHNLLRTVGDSEYEVVTTAAFTTAQRADEELIPWDVGGPEHLAELRAFDVREWIEQAHDHPQVRLLDTNVGASVLSPGEKSRDREWQWGPTELVNHDHYED